MPLKFYRILRSLIPGQLQKIQRIKNILHIRRLYTIPIHIIDP